MILIEKLKNNRLLLTYIIYSLILAIIFYVLNWVFFTFLYDESVFYNLWSQIFHINGNNNFFISSIVSSTFILAPYFIFKWLNSDNNEQSYTSSTQIRATDNATVTIIV